MAARLFAVLLVVGVAAALSHLDAPAITQELVDSINNDRTSTWKAGWNDKFTRATLKDAKDLCGALPTPSDFHHSELMHQAVAQAIPDTFDARTNWPDCAEIIGHIRDQSVCGSCWAFGAVEAFEDRLCIENRWKGLISPYDILACCSSCGMGCNGGYPSSAWSYFKNTGCVSGGDYGDSKTCAPYTFKPCDHHINGTYGPCGDTQPTPNCVHQCQNGYAQPWDADKHKAVSSYSVGSSVAAIQTEIMTYGPVEAAFTVYNDFLTYKSGVYQHKSGSQLGGHAIKMLGWGVENGTPYWLIANSWNAGWGDEGYFKILRGKNECGIESGIVAGRV